MIDYTQFPGLAGVYLEDSYVLAISDSLGQFIFRLEAVLTTESRAYRAPRPGELHSYAAGILVFPEVTLVEWESKSQGRFTDAAGEEDLGNIDILAIDGDSVVVEGDWGRVRIHTTARPRFELVE